MLCGIFLALYNCFVVLLSCIISTVRCIAVNILSYFILVVLQCYRRQAIPMEQAKIRPSVTLYSLDRSWYG